MKIAFVLSLLSSSANAAGGNYDFKKNGADWKDSYPDCGKPMQSPIDLKTSWAVESAKDDGFNKIYTN